MEFNCETSIYRSCGKLAEGPEKSHGNDEELGRWNSTMYPGEVRLRITFTLVCMPIFLAQMLRYLCVDQLMYNCGLLVYEGYCRGCFLSRHGHDQDGSIVGTLNLTNIYWINLNSMLVSI